MVSVLKLPQEWVTRLRPRWQGKSVCVTGGAGFIGGHLVDALLSLGCRLSVIDDLSNSTAEHLAELIDLEPERVRFVHGSILDDTALAEAMGGFDGDPARVVFHLAAMSSVPRSIAEPERSYSVNAVGTLRVAESARAAGVKRIVYSASSSAYGASEKLPKIETEAPAPVSPYACGKLAGEHIMHAWARSYGISTVSLRYFNIFGPRQPADSPYAAVIAVFARKLLAGQPATIFGDGSQSRDFTYVSNAVLANLLAGSTEKPLAGEVVNVGTGRQVDLLTLHAQIAQACGAPHLSPEHEPARAGDVRHSLADLTRAAEVLGYQPIVSFESGLEQTMAWYRSIYAAGGGAAHR